eukprot:449420-Rhodomonas_salina.1
MRSQPARALSSAPCRGLTLHAVTPQGAREQAVCKRCLRRVDPGPRQSCSVSARARTRGAAAGQSFQPRPSGAVPMGGRRAGSGGG